MDGICKLLSPAALGALTNKQHAELVKEAEAFMQSIRTTCNALKVPRTIAIKCIGRADCRCIYLICGKQKDAAEGKVYKSISEIATVPWSVISLLIFGVPKFGVVCTCMCCITFKLCIAIVFKAPSLTLS